MLFVPLLFVAASAVTADSTHKRDLDQLNFVYPWSGTGPYNASGSISFPAYDLSKPASEQPDHGGHRPSWIWTQRIKYVASLNSMLWTSLLTDPDHLVTDRADNTTNRAIKGWDFCYMSYSGLIRNTTDPVTHDCASSLTPACVDLIKKAGADCHAASDENLNACAIKGQGGSFERRGYAQFLASRQRGVSAAGVTGGYLGIDTYEEAIRRPGIVYARWAYDNKTVSEQLLCFGLDHFELGSRTLADVLGVKAVDNPPDGATAANTTGSSDGKLLPTDTPAGKPGDTTDNKGKSAGSIAAVSLVIGMAAFILAL